MYRRALLEGQPPSQHANACDACRRFADRERETAELVRRAHSHLAAPVALRERIAAALEDARRPQAPLRAWKRRTIVLGIAAGLALAALRVWPEAPPARTDEMADRIVADYLEYAPRADKAQLASTSAKELEAWYAREVKLAANLPELRGARLIGGRHCRFGDRSAALTFFDLDGTPLSLFVMESREADWSSLDRVASLPGKRKACRHERRGVALLVWQERGLDYVLAGAVDAEQLEDLVR